MKRLLLATLLLAAIAAAMADVYGDNNYGEQESIR
jgi:hypothetical protein